MVEPEVAERRRAIRRGIEFIYQTACDPRNFELYGFDYLSCFDCIASTSCEPKLRQLAKEMGRERARHWRNNHSDVRPDTDAHSIAYLVFGNAAADRLDIVDKRIKKQIENAARDFAATDYYGFDIANEPPPEDVPDECECGVNNLRGRKRCSKCKARLAMRSRYALWLDALCQSYVGERYGVTLGTSFADVFQWLPAMRPYPEITELESPDTYWAAYVVTHLIYVLNDYSRYCLSPRLLPVEYAYLKRNLKPAMVMDDPEIVGEFLDTLKSFGLSADYPLMKQGLDYLLSRQNADGSWGDIDCEDIYQRYHPTWTAIDGLREYSWRSGISFPKVKPLLREWARNGTTRIVLPIPPETKLVA